MNRETSESGAPIYRHDEVRNRIPDVVSGDPELIEAVSAHIETWLGPVEFVMHEIVSTDVHLDVHVVRATRERPIHFLVTSGMSERRMNVPAECADLARAELMIALPASWPVDGPAVQEAASWWPIRMFKELARMPHEHDTWLSIGHTIANGDPAPPYDSSTELCAALLLPPITAPQAFAWMSRSGGVDDVHFYSVVPLYAEEVDFKLKHGLDALLERFEAHGVTEVIDPKRPSVVPRKKKRFWPF